MASEFLSVTPQRLRCYACGKFSEDANQWTYRLRLGGHSAVCPSCKSRVERDIEEQTSAPSFSGALLMGSLAAAAGGVAWYAIAVATDRAFAYAAVGVGWLVGNAAIWGSGKKRGPTLQIVAGLLAAGGILGGRYLIVNHVFRTLGIGGFAGWLSLKQFAAIYGQLLAHGENLSDLVFALIAVSVAYVLPRADKLVAELPRRARRWPWGR